MVLDDPLIADGNKTFLAGQVSSVPANTIPESGFASAQNMDFDPQGRLVTRRGAKTTTGNIEDGLWETADGAVWETADGAVWGSSLSSSYPIDALFYFDTHAAEYLVVAQNGQLYQGTESAAYAAITSATYSGAIVYFAQLNNRLYYCDGVGALKYIDSSVTYSAITAGKVTSIRMTGLGVGYNAVPTITFTHNGGASGAATAVLGYGGRVISGTVTTNGSGYSATTPPTIAFTAAPAGGTTAAGIVNISQLPSKPKFLTSHTERIFCASNDTSVPPDTLYASDILDGESWDLAGSSVRIGGDGDPITGIYPWFDNNLIVFKQRSVWVVDADPALTADQWNIALINNRVGCVSHKTIQAVGSDVYFLSRTGVRAVSQIQAGAQTDVGLPLSQQIQDVIDGADFSYSDYFCSAYYRNRYILGVVVSGQTRPTICAVFNRVTNSWSGSWSGWNPTGFTVTAFSGNLRLQFGSSTGRVWTWDDFTTPSTETGSEYRDDTMDYESYVVTRAYDYGEPLVKKKGYMMELLTENKLTGDAVTAYLSYDKDQTGSFTTMSNSINLTASTRQITVAKNLLSLTKHRTIQFKFGTTRFKVAVNSLVVTGYADNLVPEVSA